MLHEQGLAVGGLGQAWELRLSHLSAGTWPGWVTVTRAAWPLLTSLDGR